MNFNFLYYFRRTFFTQRGLFRFYSAKRRNEGDFEGSTNIVNVGERLLECYRVLDLPQTCTKEELKGRYLELAKKYHPDTGGRTADVDAFRRLHSAYRFIVDNDYGVTDRRELENVPKIFDIRHTAPQHRQYLEYGGVGHGTPSQRMRQYQQFRVEKATENVNEYMVNKLLTNENDYSLITKSIEEREYARKWKTRSAVDRLVEDLIQESMRRGEFENLSGVGKPLAYETHNPYLDSMTHKLNQVLIQNGFCPEWVLMEKEIRTEMRRIKQELSTSYQTLDSTYYSTRQDERERVWSKTINKLQEDCKSLNKRIDSFNLLVPSLYKQMVHFSLDREIKKILTSNDASSAKEAKRLDTSPNVGSETKSNNGDTLAESVDSSEKKDGKEIERKDKPMGIFRLLLYAMTHDKMR